MDRIPAEQGGDLYLINGNMTKLEDAGIFAASAGKENEDEEQEVLEMDEPDGSKGSQAGRGIGRGNRGKGA
jgi:hypothetical protein